MKILITGGNGFIARNIKNNLISSNIVCLSRQELDLTNQESVDSFFSDKYFDVVIHTATVGGSRLETDDKSWVNDNLSMYQNLLRQRNKFTKLINLTSGAELDRRFDINGESPFDRFPVDPYGLSKNLISRMNFYNDNCYNIRIYNVFNHDELPTRMIRNNILNYISKNDLMIYKDRFMDFFHIDDFIKIINFYCNEKDLPKNIDCSYEIPTKLSDIAHMINNLDTYKSKVIIENQIDNGKSYCGNPFLLKNLNLKLDGLENSIKKTFIKIIDQANV